MSKQRRAFSVEFTAKVGLEALKGIEPIHVIAQRHEVHPVQVSQWKKEVSERLPEVFAKPSAQVRDEIERNRKERKGTVCADRAAADGARVAQKKLAHLESKERRSMIETEHPKLSVARQCELLELPRSTYYHHPNHEVSMTSWWNTFLTDP
ncbi:MAG: transposase [Candidatus Synoicihabitans palmerolidicus]|nr:transposase [Candidatus Synoicihabitans palmerolidicus]MCC5025942.1 transposase [Candidatus Synoicihabitans palmerolidicus]